MIAGPAAVVVVCLILTAIGTAATAMVHRQVQQRLLEQQVAEASAVLTSAIGTIDAVMATSARVTDSAIADQEAFELALAPSIEVGRFVGAVLLDADGEHLAQVGEPLGLVDGAGDAEMILERASSASGLAVLDDLVDDGRRLGYAYASPSGSVVYAESPLPPDRTGAPRSAGPFGGLDFALYLGAERDPDHLLFTSADSAPMEGRTSATTVAFGDTELTLAARSDTELPGTLPAMLPWLVAVGGVVFTVLAGAMTHRLLASRRHAEQLADEQRVQADTLRRSLLPRHLPEVAGLETAARYWPADTSNEIGGDFYDFFHVHDRTWALVMGDVCGKGVEAAALTGLTRHTIRAAARHTRSPSEVLQWTHEAIVDHHADTYCTVCFAFIEIEPDGGARLDLVLGGHPPPIHLHGESVSGLGQSGTLLGLIDLDVHTTTHHLVAGDALVMYTDGITDAPGADRMGTDDLCEILSASADRSPDGLAESIRSALVGSRPEGNYDDTAVLIIRLTPDDE